MCLKDFFRSVIISFDSSKPICKRIKCSFLFNLKKFLFPISVGPLYIARLSNPPQLYPIPNNSRELINLITEDLLLALTITPNKPVDPE